MAGGWKVAMRLSTSIVLMWLAVVGGWGQLALLPEVGRCPVWWEEPTTIPLTSEPHEALFAVPRGGNEIWYGMLQLGSGEDSVVHVAFWPGDGGGPRLWLDSNGNGDLTDDGDGLWMWKYGWHEYVWQYTVLVDYGAEGRLPYSIRFSAMPDYGFLMPESSHLSPYSLWARSGGFQQGLLDIEGRTVLFGLYDANGDGRYDDIEHTGVLVDKDGDGRFCFFCPHETFYPGETVTIGTQCYALAEVSPSGRRVRVERVEQSLCNRPVFAPGWPAPDFNAQTLDGQDITLSQLSAQATVVVLVSPRLCAMGRGQLRDCPVCPTRDVCEELREFGEIVARVEEYRSKVALVMVITDPELPPAAWLDEFAPFWEIIWDKDGKLFRLYYGCPGALIIDHERTIRFVGLEQSTILDGFGCYRYEYGARMANVLDLLWALARVLADQG
ncbi:MAG TPA: redoxin domain-containing protein [Candidatus Bipolaricaulis sp.]|nr:redoxin domain-containing protein [Candidatus Bipolaricaulis sp.]HRS13468.1 redoxin domain-containing protein [Candidatus Bipolaricaulis sp.]HRU22102.1 redoxin domain-containing protein [Candidatus Bipolaricaulis sp.]